MVGDGFERRRQIENEAWANELASLREMFDPVPAKADGMASDGRPECPRSQAAERTAGLLPFDRRVSHRRPVRATGASNTDAYPRTLTPLCRGRPVGRATSAKLTQHSDPWVTNRRFPSRWAHPGDQTQPPVKSATASPGAGV
jgi:hypothetical protein